MTLELRVIYGDTDQMGVVYYANYLRYFEAARGAWLRDRGHSYHELEAAGLHLPVAEAHVRYRKPARYEDLLRIDARVEEVRAASFRFAYAITRGEELVAEGWTLHACIDRTGQPIRLPRQLRDLLGPPPTL